MKLIDRINLFFKIGAFVDVPFDKTNTSGFAAFSGARTWRTALQIAKELHEYAKEDELHAERSSASEGSCRRMPKTPKHAGRPSRMLTRIRPTSDDERRGRRSPSKPTKKTKSKRRTARSEDEDEERRDVRRRRGRTGADDEDAESGMPKAIEEDDRCPRRKSQKRRRRR
jgi:hypothetical protein